MAMATEKCSAFVRHQDRTAVVDLTGEIDGFAEDELNRAYDEAESYDPGRIVLNFSEVNYINSTGIALIVALLAKARKARREITAFGLSDHYTEIFRITRLSDFMRIAEDETGALAEVADI
jgi:anti-anti-sigma factor